MDRVKGDLINGIYKKVVTEKKTEETTDQSVNTETAKKVEEQVAERLLKKEKSFQRL